MFFRLLFYTKRDLVAQGVDSDPFTEVLDDTLKNCPNKKTLRIYLTHPIISILWWGNEAKQVPGFINSSLMHSMLGELDNQTAIQARRKFKNLNLPKTALPIF